jgi:uncharacterized membrane protein
MDSGAMELLDLVFRWVHVIAAIMWIGNSLLFNWLDRNLLPPQQGKAGVQGEIWLLHSGGFYLVEKDLRGWDRARPLHWFKWQAYTTWLTGAALLVVVYYAGGGALLVDPSVAELGHGTAVLIALGTLVGVWLVYDLLAARLLARTGWLGAPLGLAVVGAVGWGLLQVLSGRAAFLHVGAMLGTVMAGNVVRMIMPSQRQLVGAAERGERPDPALAGRAKERSIHNNYMTFPVVALMLSAHFPGLYGHRHAWLSLVVILVTGAAVRHLLNIRFTFAGWRPALAGVGVAAVALLYLLGRGPAAAAPAAAAPSREVTFADAHAVIDKRCTVCHSASPADRSFGPAPAGVSFDTPAQIRAFADRIRVRAVETRTMPPANKTWITPDEREVLREWMESGGGR